MKYAVEESGDFWRREDLFGMSTTHISVFEQC